MLEVLFQLMEDGQYDKCLRLAEQQLLRGGWNIGQLAQINMVICRCRLGLQDPYGAIPSGLLASKLAKDVGDWDLLGRTLLNLATGYVGVRQYDQALHHLYSFLEHLYKYNNSRKLEGAAWKHIGIVHQRKLESDKAIEALMRARTWFARNGVDYSSFTCTHDLINTYLQMHDTDPATSLEPVAQFLQYEKEMVDKYPEESFFAATHWLDRAAYYLHLGRIKRSIVCAQKAMETGNRDHSLSFHSHMILHRCNLALGDAKQAFAYALAARVEALQGRHFELEFLATQSMAEVIRMQGVEVVRELDQEYQAIGIDLGQYLSPAILRRTN